MIFLNGVNMDKAVFAWTGLLVAIASLALAGWVAWRPQEVIPVRVIPDPPVVLAPAPVSTGGVDSSAPVAQARPTVIPQSTPVQPTVGQPDTPQTLSPPRTRTGEPPPAPPADNLLEITFEPGTSTQVRYVDVALNNKPLGRVQYGRDARGFTTRLPAGNWHFQYQMVGSEVLPSQTFTDSYGNGVIIERSSTVVVDAHNMGSGMYATTFKIDNNPFRSQR
jgi:hypothetical protein